MKQRTDLLVISEDGIKGVIVDRYKNDSGEDVVIVLFETHDRVVVPISMLRVRAEGELYLPVPIRQESKAAAPPSSEQVLVVPVAEEHVSVDSRPVETGRVRIHKYVETHDETIDQPLQREELSIEHVPVNKIVENAPEARREGDAFVIPLFEEVLVVEKRLLLREEVRITRKRAITHSPQRVSLRKEQVRVERQPIEQTGQDDQS